MGIKAVLFFTSVLFCLGGIWVQIFEGLPHPERSVPTSVHDSPPFPHRDLRSFRPWKYKDDPGEREEIRLEES